MKLKEHYARFKMITIHHLLKSIFKCLLKPLWLILYLLSILYVTLPEVKSRPNFLELNSMRKIDLPLSFK